MQITPLKSGPFEILDQFDMNDPKNLGRPLYFRLDLFIAVVESLICSDEIEMALKLMEMVPAWHRENYPEELTRMKKLLYQNLYDCYTYASDADEAGWTKENAEKQFTSGYAFPRAEVLRDLVASHNHVGRTPWLCEFSPSHGLLPLGLAKEGHKFNFFGKNLNHPALVKLKGWLEPGVWQEAPSVDQPTIFVFTECWEHSYREKDVYDAYMKLGVDFDHIVLSVPFGTMGHGLPNWKTRPIGHIRTYSQQEFFDLADRFFPNRKWKLIKSVSMVLQGDK